MIGIFASAGTNASRNVALFEKCCLRCQPVLFWPLPHCQLMCLYAMLLIIYFCGAFPDHAPYINTCVTRRERVWERPRVFFLASPAQFKKNPDAIRIVDEAGVELSPEHLDAELEHINTEVESLQVRSHTPLIPLMLLLPSSLLQISGGVDPQPAVPCFDAIGCPRPFV